MNTDMATSTVTEKRELSLTYAFGQRKCVMCHVSCVDNVHVNIALVSIFTCNGGQSYENL